MVFAAAAQEGKTKQTAIQKRMNAAVPEKIFFMSWFISIPRIPKPSLLQLAGLQRSNMPPLLGKFWLQAAPHLFAQIFKHGGPACVGMLHQQLLHLLKLLRGLLLLLSFLVKSGQRGQQAPIEGIIAFAKGVDPLVH